MLSRSQFLNFNFQILSESSCLSFPSIDIILRNQSVILRNLMMDPNSLHMVYVVCDESQIYKTCNSAVPKVMFRRCTKGNESFLVGICNLSQHLELLKPFALTDIFKNKMQISARRSSFPHTDEHSIHQCTVTFGCIGDNKKSSVQYLSGIPTSILRATNCKSSESKIPGTHWLAVTRCREQH